jgi:hypothetical protein
MNVFLLEDRGATAYYVVEWLKENKYKVLEAFNVNDAQNHWNNRHQIPIDCIILDLNLPTDGLTEPQKKKSAGGLLSGWVWFSDCIISEMPEMKSRTIIYSDYITTLKRNVSENEYRDIVLIPKRGRSSSAEEVVSWIKKIEKK